MHFALFVALLAAGLSVASPPHKYRKIHSLDKNILKLPDTCLEQILSFVRNPYQLADFMATCSNAAEFIERNKMSPLLNRLNDDELEKRRRFYVVSNNFELGMSKGNPKLLNDVDLFIKPADIIAGHDNYKIDWYLSQMNIPTRSYYIIPIRSESGTDKKTLFYGENADKSYIMYASLQKYSPPRLMTISNPVKTVNSKRSLENDAWSGFIFDSQVKKMPFQIFLDRDTFEFIDPKTFVYYLHACLLNLKMYGEKIHVRFNERLLDGNNAVILRRTDSYRFAHIFLSPEYTTAFDPDVPNYNAMLVVSLFSQLINGKKYRYQNVSILKVIFEFLCKFQTVRAYLNVISEDLKTFISCPPIRRRSKPLYDDQISISLVLEDLEHVRRWEQINRN